MIDLGHAAPWGMVRFFDASTKGSNCTVSAGSEGGQRMRAHCTACVRARGRGGWMMTRAIRDVPQHGATCCLRAVVPSEQHMCGCVLCSEACTCEALCSLHRPGQPNPTGPRARSCTPCRSFAVGLG